MQTQILSAQKSNPAPRPARGRQLVNQLKLAVGAKGPSDPLELLKLLDDPAVTEGFLKKSQALHEEERSGDRLERSSAPRGFRRDLGASARSADPSLMAALRLRQLACPLRA